MDSKNAKLKYMIIGAGGTGGAIGSHLSHAGYDVTFIARGRHLAAMKERGLRVIRPDTEFTVYPVSAETTDDFLEKVRNAGPDEERIQPDVIFVCVKGYSVEETFPFIAEAAAPDTLIIPILNIFGTGAQMQKELPWLNVTDGCIYVASEIREPGVLWMKGTILRVVFGLRQDQKSSGQQLRTRLEQIESDLRSSGIEGVLSDNIERDALRKFSYVSPQGACGLYYDVPVGAMQHPGEIQDCFAGLIGEISELADAMGIGFGEDIVSVNLDITKGLAPDMTTSLQRDVAAGKSTEIDGLIYEVVRMGEKYGVSVPIYEKISAELKRRGL